MFERTPQSTARRVVFKAFTSSDHVTAATGKTIAVQISKNGGSFANPAAGATNATEIASGWYYVDLGTGDSGTLGPLIVRGTEGTIDPAEVVFTVVEATTLGATHLDAIKTKTDLIPGTQDGKTFAERITLMAAVLLGKASGLGTTTATYRAIDDSKDRITATVDASGNRSAVTLDAS